MNINDICNLIEAQPDCEMNVKRTIGIIPKVLSYTIESKEVELTTYDLAEIIVECEKFMLLVQSDCIKSKTVKFNKYTCVYSYVDSQIIMKVLK